MIRIEDLRIGEEFLPLIDFTRNRFSKEILCGMLHQPLHSVAEIMDRQNVLKGFIAHYEVLKTYAYSSIDLQEVYDFLLRISRGVRSKNRLRLRLLLSGSERHSKRARLVQLVLLFHKLQVFYFHRLQPGAFPESYRAPLNSINNFLAGFNLIHYEKLITEDRFGIREMVHLMTILEEKAGSEETEEFWQQFFLFEAYVSISTGMVRHGFLFPEFSDTAFSVREFYHPILKDPVTNSLTLENNVILLTGPNMSGKSTLLKALSLCVYLAHTGLGIPAAAARMPFFDTIAIAINLQDDIIAGYSHFMTEVMHLKQLVAQAGSGKKCFAVFDELFRGTNTEDAVEISTTTIRGLTRFKGSVFLISTHLHQLRDLEELRLKKVATYYLGCTIIDGAPKFSYKLEEGWSDLRAGRILFEKEGLNEMLG